MKFLHVASVFSVSIALSANPAFGAKRFLDLEATETQDSRMSSGVEAIDNNEAGTSVRIVEPEDKVRKRMFIQISALNASDAPINFGPENIVARIIDGEEIAVISYEKLAKEEKNRRKWAAIATGLGAASNSIAASNAGNYNGTVYSGGRVASFSGYNAGSAYAAQSLANLENQSRFDQLARNNAASDEQLRSYLRTTTIDPGTSFGGTIVIEMPKTARKTKYPLPFEIKVSFGDDTHFFTGNIIVE